LVSREEEQNHANQGYTLLQHGQQGRKHKYFAQILIRSYYSISASIRDILTNSCYRPIENSNLFVNDKINSDSISQHIVPYGKIDGDTSSKLKLPISNCKGVAEWIDNKSDPFVCLDLKPTPQKNRLNKSKCTFNFTFCDHVFDILLQNNFIRIIDHSALPSIQNLEELTYCK
jgi:hypothetical protein